MALPITREEILIKLSEFQAHQFVEVTSPDSYEKSHLPRAVILPSESAQARAEKLLPDHGHQLFVYDEGEGTEAWRVARLLEAEGHRNVFVYEAGKRDWLANGEVTESHAEPNPAQFDPAYPSFPDIEASTGTPPGDRARVS